MEEGSNTCTTLIDGIKHSDDVSLKKKLSKKSKSKKKKADKKERKKYKKRNKCSTSSSSSESDDNDKFDWVEKKVKDQTTLHINKNTQAQTDQFERDEWMNLESFLPCVSKFDMRKQKLDKEKEEKTKILNNPGQSNKELNPYWKDGGNGLPQNSSKTVDNPQILDANWLKKSLQRAKEQALRDGKSLKEVAAERWGSLEIIQSMIIKAEEMSNTGQTCHKKYHENHKKYDKSLHRSLKRKNRSRSRSKERTRKYSTSDDLFHHTSQQKQTYPRSKVNDYHRETAHESTNRIKNWKKTKDDGKKSDSSKLKEISVENINTNVIDKNKVVGPLTEAEMNKLAAKIIKAELMGDDDLAAKLKIQLEQARELTVTNNSNMQEETVILTITDEKGVTRPIQSRNRFEQSREGHKRKKTAETRVSSHKKHDFINDSNSLQNMFQEEKGKSMNEDEKTFIKFASKSMNDMDDVFEHEIARTDLEAKEDKRNRAQAIKEHKDLSKSMDNCWWCLDSKNMLKHMIVTMDSKICLSLPACTSLITHHCILTPVQHVACQLQLDEDVWDRLKEFKRKLTQMFNNEDLYPIFFEVYKKHHKFSHMQLECIPLPKEFGESAPMYFKKALLECETEWSVNKKIIDLKYKDVRHAVPNGLSYFMVEFASHSGYAHIIEDKELFPKNFAEEIIGGMLDLDCKLWRKPKRLNFDEQRVKVLKFTEIWKKYNPS